MLSGAKIKRRRPFVYGYIVTIGPNGKPVIHKFGNFEPVKKASSQTTKNAIVPEIKPSINPVRESCNIF